MAGEALFFIDTNVLIRHLRQKAQPTILDKARAQFGTPVVSEFVVFELEVGARRAGREFEFQTHFSSLRTYPLSLPVLLEAAAIQAALLRENQIIGLPDTFIAATAIYHDIPLFTLNVEHFRRVTGLRLLDNAL